MLLRRVTEHVKNQNWIAVGIDFAIVVIGVFIGLQVANWSETRAQYQRELTYLERLDAEFEIVENRLNQTIATSELARNSLRSLSQAHDQGAGAFSNGDAKSAVELLVGSVSAVVPARSPRGVSATRQLETAPRRTRSTTAGSCGAAARSAVARTTDLFSTSYGRQ